MENTNVTMISDLTLAQDDYTIKVRIIRLWKQIRMIGMILMDERGAKIECNVDKPFSYLQGNNLEEYGDYYIQKPTIGLNNGIIKFVDGPHKLYFQYSTKVIKCKDFCGPRNSFAFIDFKQLHSNSIQANLSFDIIGNVFQCFPLEPPKDKQEQKITLKMEDLEGHEVFVTLWGRYADEIVAYVSKHHGHFVMIIQLAKFKKIRERPYVNNTYLATKLFIEDNIVEITAFKKSLQARKTSSCSSVSRASGSSIMYSLHDDFLQKNSFYKISTIHELNEGNCAVILGTIKMFEDMRTWYYNACTKCKSKVILMDVPNEAVNDLDRFEEKKMMFCPKKDCKGKDVIAEPSYMIKVRVQGLVGVVSLTMFDREVRNLLKISAAELISKYERFDNPSDFPNELNAMLNKKLAFKIVVKTLNSSKFGRYYNISKITDNFDIIVALENIEKKNIIEQDMDNDSVNAVGSEFASQDTVGCKDVNSHTDDNTPVSNIPSGNSTSPSSVTATNNLNSPPTSVKRKLVDIYDLDDDVYESATKPNASRVDNDKAGITTKLLIPKVEK
ncbi:unnamed protein product [Lactuca saligna]|uniref:Replication protein A subunit n=2 Tax=Lactuca saligna TaxID=75948 RepID=A0AA36EDE8_LACSI|nr:unnamed protein product [Lactuca saligna]